MPHYYDDGGERVEVTCGCFTISMLVIIIHYIYLMELRETNPDLYWIVIIAQ